MFGKTNGGDAQEIFSAAGLASAKLPVESEITAATIFADPGARSAILAKGMGVVFSSSIFPVSRPFCASAKEKRNRQRMVSTIVLKRARTRKKHRFFFYKGICSNTSVLKCLNVRTHSFSIDLPGLIYTSGKIVVWKKRVKCS